eukprot:scaffold14137_cov17-Tisochrysis_lutea.AAC.6
MHLNCCVEAFEHLMPRQLGSLKGFPVRGAIVPPFPKPRLLHKLLKVGPSVFWGHMGWANDPLHLQGYLSSTL